MTKVGALVSAFYCEEYLRARIENLLDQIEVPQILAVCLRGSAEHRILAKYGVPVISTTEVPTIYGAWNRLIEITSAEYLVVANSDDEFYPHALKRMREVLDANPDISLVYPDADITFDFVSGEPHGRFQLAEYDPETMFVQCYMGPMPMWRRSLHDKYGPFDGQMQVAGDYEFWLRMSCAGEKFLHIPEALGVYLSRPNSREHKETIRTLWETARAKSRYTKEAYGPENPHSEASYNASHDTLPLPRTPRTVDGD